MITPQPHRLLPVRRCINLLPGRRDDLAELCQQNLIILDKEYAGFAQGMKDHGYSAAAVKTLSETLEQAPKSRRWKLRDRIGERKRWYELPEETPHH